MAVFPLQVFTQGGVQAGFNEDYKSSPLGVRYAGQPKGAYVGFIPSVLGSVLTFDVDPTFGYSLVKVGSNVDPSGMDVFVTDPVTLDFVGQPDLDFPMNVMVRISYYADGTVPTSAEVFSRSATVAVGANEALLCVVDGPAAALTLAADVSLQERDEPLAYGHINFGFMPGGSIESLQAAADIVNEVIAARAGLDGTAYTNLNARITGDFSATSMASRLALAFYALRSNDYDIAAGGSGANVSGSFTQTDRDHNPKITLDGSGGETSEGAIADPNDIVRNVVLVVDASTGYRPIDDETERRVIFGRLSGPNQKVVGGVWQFLNASRNVVTTDGNGQATIEFEAGNAILGPDGAYYEVDSILTNNSIELRSAFQGVSATVTSTQVTQWKVLLKKIVSGVEVDAALLDDTTIRFFFPTFLSMKQSNADWRSALHTAAERVPLPSASTVVPGMVRLANSGALLGSVNIQNAGTPIAGGPFHTINFNAANASVVAAPGDPQEVEVVEIGPVGATGDDGSSGAPGDPGDTGPGYSTLNPFEISTELPGTPGLTVMWSFTKDMGHNVRYISGGIAKWRDNGFFSTPGDRLDVSDVVIASATEGRIEGSMGGVFGDVFVTPFLSSAGD